MTKIFSGCLKLFLMFTLRNTNQNLITRDEIPMLAMICKEQ